ncbi:hypothetical protein CEXT_60951, partial [Caerostris extrusa]
ISDDFDYPLTLIDYFMTEKIQENQTIENPVQKRRLQLLEVETAGQSGHGQGILDRSTEGRRRRLGGAGEHEQAHCSGEDMRFKASGEAVQDQVL